MEAQRLHLLRVPSESRQLAFGTHVPDLDELSLADSQADAVGMPGNRLAQARADRKLSLELTGAGVENRYVARCDIADGEPAVVRVKGEGPRVAGLGNLPASELLTGRHV